MEQTISARFDSMDAADAAAMRVKSHFNNIKSVRISYKSILAEQPQDNALLSGLFTPVPLVNGIYTNGILPPTVSGAAIRDSLEDTHAGSSLPAPDHVTVTVTATGKNANAIAASLRFSGGIDVKS